MICHVVLETNLNAYVASKCVEQGGESCSVCTPSHNSSFINLVLFVNCLLIAFQLLMQLYGLPDVVTLLIAVCPSGSQIT